MALLRLQSPLAGIWYMVGIGFGGEVYSWFFNNVYRGEGGEHDHDELVRAAEQIPAGSEELIFLPFLGGTFTPPNERVRARWCGLDWKHSVYHLYRSVLESIAYEYAYYHGIYSEISAGAPCRSVTVAGSGKKNALWNRIKADVLGCDYLCLNRDDHENLGTALVAAHAVGLTTDIRGSLRNCLEVERRFSPVVENAAAYERMFQRYLKYREEAMMGSVQAMRQEGAGRGA